MDLVQKYSQILSKGVGGLLSNVEHKAAPVVNNAVNFVQKNPNFVASRLTSPLMPTIGDLPTLYGQQKVQIPRIDLASKINTGNNIRDKALKLAASFPESIINAPSDYQRGIGNINKGHLIQGAAQAGMAAFNIGTLAGGSIAEDIGKNVVKEAGIPALRTAIKQGAANGALYGGGYGALSGLASSNNHQEQIKQVLLQGAGGAVGGAVLGGGVGALGNRVGAFKSAKLSSETDPWVPQLRDAAGRFAKAESHTPVKPKGMPNGQWKYQLDFNAKYRPNESAYTPVFPSDLEKAIKYELGKRAPGLTVRDINKDINPLGDQVSSKELNTTSALQKEMQTNAGGNRTNQISPSQLSSELNNSSNKSIANPVSTEIQRGKQLIEDAKAVGNRNYRTLQAEPMMNLEGKSYQVHTPTEALSQSQSQLPQGSQISSSGLTSNSDSLSGIIPEVKQAVMGASVKEKQLIARVKGSTKYDPEMTSVLNGTYVPKSNNETIALARKAVKIDPVAAEARARAPQNVVDQAIGAELFGKYMMSGDVAKANEIINATSGTTQGQMVQILSKYDKTTPAGAVKFAQTTINNYNKAHPNAQLSLTDDVVKSLFDKASAIQKMPQGRERNIMSQHLIEQVNALVPSSMADKAITVWKAGLLTSLRTHERNLIGNTIHGAAETAKDIPAVMADKALSLKTGKRTTTLTVRGIGSGAKKGGVAAKDIIRTGFDPEETINAFDVKNITWGNNPVEQGLKKYTDAVFRTLGGADKPFYHAAFGRSLYDQAGAEAINAGKAGDKKFIENLVKNPTTKMLTNAVKDAETATFKNKNRLSEGAGSLKRKFGPVGDVVAPFTGVPSAIAGQLIAYSPAGLVKGIASAGKVVAQNVPDLQRQASQEIGRGVIGTGLLGIGAYLASKKLISGQPKDAQEAAQWKLEGKSPNSVFIGGKWRSIGSIGPENLIILAGAKAQQELSPTGGGAGQLAAGIGKDFLGQTFLQGVQGPLNALNDPSRYAQQYTQGLVASIIPNLAKDVAKATDPVARQANNIPDAFKAGIPIVRKSLNPQRDALGNQVAQEPTGLGAFVDLFNSKTPVSSSVIDELSRLNSTGNNSTPSKLQKDQTIQGEKTTLNPKQLDALTAEVGSKTASNLAELFATPEYKALSDQDKATAVDSVVAQTRKQVRANFDASGNTTTSSSTPSTGNKYTLVNPDTGSVKTIDLSKPISAPTLTGNIELDKKLKSSYSSALTARSNDILDLYKAGKIDANEAEKALNELKIKKLSAGTGKGRKAKLIKVSIPKAKKISVKSLKPKKPKQYKLAKVKVSSNIRVKKIKRA